MDRFAEDDVSDLVRDFFKTTRQFFSAHDDRMSVGEHEAFRRLPWSARRRILKQRKSRVVDIWSADDGYRPTPGLLGGGSMSYEETLESIIADGTQISNSTTETIVCPDFSFPAFYMQPARTIRVWAYGVNSNVVTTPGTLTLRVRWGGVAGTVLVASAAQGLDTTAHTNALWALQAFIVCRTAGASGTFMSGGKIDVFNLLASTAANLLPGLLGSAGAPGASGNVAVTVDTTAAKLLSVTGQFSVATSPTNLTCQQRIIEAMN
jgi:hypothetical protein